MEPIEVTFKFGRIAFENLCNAFENDRWMSWKIRDHIFKFEIDSTIADESVIHVHEGRRLETQRLMDYTFPHTYLPDDVTKIVNLAYSEAIRSYEVGCFMACIGLCGRAIGTALGSPYEKKTGTHPSAESHPPGMNAILNRLKREGYVFPPALKEKMEVIALHRNSAIHGNVVVPTDDEARSVVYSARDALKAVAV